MTSSLVADATVPASPAERDTARARVAPRLVPAQWPATSASRQEVLGRLTRPPFVLSSAGSQKQRVTGLGLLLDWLADQPGRSWQERWLASGADAARSRWRQVPASWLRNRGQYSDGRRDTLCGALHVAICADVARPSPSWFAAAVMRGGILTACMSEVRDPAGFARLRELCVGDPRVSAAARTHILHRAAVIMGAKGASSATSPLVMSWSWWRLRRAPTSAPCRTAPGSTGCCTRQARSGQPRVPGRSR